MTPTLAAIGWTTPALLGGVALVALPIVAHLLNRRAKRKVVFPSIALLAASSASQSQLFKLRRWWLLLLRCLAVVLLAAAFARPLWVNTPQSEAQAHSAAGDQRGRAAVLLVDVSASSAQRTAGVTALHSLQAAAGRTLDNLLTGADVANLVTASARPGAALPTLSANLEALRARLQKLEPTAERADLAGALTLAGKQLARHDGPRHVVILSDLQATNWRPALRSLSGANPFPDHTRITLVPISGAAPGNLALADANVTPPRPLTDERCRATVTLVNHSDAPRNVTVQLTIDGSPTDERAVTVQPRQQRDVGFDLTLPQPDQHTLRFDLSDDQSDALPIDNQRYLTVRAVRRPRVVVLGDDAPDEPGTASYFLMRALAPRGTTRDGFAVRHVTSAQAEWADFREAGVIVVSRVNELDRAVLTVLHRHLDRGGGVVFYCGDGPVAANLSQFNQITQSVGAPLQLGARRNLAARGDALTLAEADWQAPLLNPFDARDADGFARIQFHRVWTVTEPSEAARVLMRFNDGTPALAQQRIGRGRMIQANFSPALPDSDLGKYGAFVALTQRLAAFLRPEASPSRVGIVGRSLTFELDETEAAPMEALRIIDPNGDPLPASAYARSSADSVVSINHPRRPGFYEAVAGDTRVHVAAANVHRDESDLRRMSADNVKRRLSASGAVAQVDAAGDRGALDAERGTPLWGWFLLAAMGVFAVELALVSWWRR